MQAGHVLIVCKESVDKLEEILLQLVAKNVEVFHLFPMCLQRQHWDISSLCEPCVNLCSVFVGVYSQPTKGRILLCCCVSIDQRCVLPRVCVAASLLHIHRDKTHAQHPLGPPFPTMHPHLPECIAISKVCIPGDIALTVRSLLPGSDTHSC